MTATAAVQPRALTADQQRARATRPDLWPRFAPAVFPGRPAAPAHDVDDLDELLDDLEQDFTFP